MENKEGQTVSDLPVEQPNDRITRLMAQDPEAAALAHVASLQKAITKGMRFAEADANDEVLEDSEEERERIAKAERRASLALRDAAITESMERIRRASLQRAELEEEAAAAAAAVRFFIGLMSCSKFQGYSIDDR